MATMHFLSCYFPVLPHLLISPLECYCSSDLRNTQPATHATSSQDRTQGIYCLVCLTRPTSE